MAETQLTTAIVLNWNTLHVAKDSIRRLSREVPTIVVDNGSTDGSREYFTEHPRDGVTYMLHERNLGSSVARNLAIDQVKTPYYFLLDGDILYVPGSIALLERVFSTYPACGIIGVHCGESVQKYGHNGTPDINEADIAAPADATVYRGFPMAWTQYGLFRKSDQRFPAQPPFDGPGYGYEDSWYYHELRERGLDSYYVERPMYYHDAHSSKRELEKAGLPDNEAARRDAFHARFGQTDWLDRAFTTEEVA